MIELRNYLHQLYYAVWFWKKKIIICRKTWVYLSNKRNE